MTTKVLKDQVLQAYYDQTFAMYGTRGWAHLMERVKEQVVAYDRLEGVDTVEQLWFRKGQLDQMNWLLKDQETHEATYNELISEQENAAPEVSSGGKATIVPDPLS
ncbi:MAG TPA: hypothetical protein VFW03_13655 [Gemmatimonadaceae bacterium]|nr:hypothetical protein [Gemmatimonadaceae bacterium]